MIVGAGDPVSRSTMVMEVGPNFFCRRSIVGYLS